MIEARPCPAPRTPSSADSRANAAGFPTTTSAARLSAGGAGGAKWTVPTVELLERASAPLRTRKAELATWLDRLRTALAQDPSWERHPYEIMRVGAAKLACAEGLRATFEGQGGAEAERMLRQALAKEPRLEEAYEALCRGAAAAGDWEKAERACRDGLEADRGYLPHLLDRAVARTRRADDGRRRGEARLNWSLTREDRGQDPGELLTAALEDFGAMRKLRPDDAEPWTLAASAHTNWGLYRLRRGEDPAELCAAAQEEFGRALALDPNSWLAWSGRGALRSNLGLDRQVRGGDPRELYAAAVQDLESALRVNPAAQEPWTVRGNVRTRWAAYEAGRGKDPSERYAAAVAVFDRALAIDPRSAIAWDGRGIADGNTGNYQVSCGKDPAPFYALALQDYGKALELDPGCADAWWQRSNTRTNWGIYKSRRGEDSRADFAAALEDVQRSLQLLPDQAQARKRLEELRSALAEKSPH